MAGFPDREPGPGNGNQGGTDPELDLEIPENADAEIEDADEIDEIEDDGADDAGGRDDGDEEDQGQAQRQVAGRSHSRRAGRAERAESQVRELRGQLTEFQRQLAEVSAQRSQPTAAELAQIERQEQEALDLMTPAEIGRYYHQKAQREFQGQLGQVVNSLTAQHDKQAFQATLAAEPRYRRFEDRVEELYSQYKGSVAREHLLTYAIGEAAKKNLGRATARGQRSRDAGTQRQAARASNGRSDVGAERSRAGTRGWEHLRDVTI